jgi:hypothetical protein
LNTQLIDILERLRVLIEVVTLALTAPLLIACNWAKVCDFDYNCLAKRTRITRRVGIFVASKSKAATTSVTSS